MVIATTTILGWCGITTNANKNTIVAEILSPLEGLTHLDDETDEGMTSTFRNFGIRDANDGKIIFIWFQQKRLISLMDWVKDKSRLNEEVTFDNGTIRNEFVTDIEQAPECKKCR